MLLVGLGGCTNDYGSIVPPAAGGSGPGSASGPGPGSGASSGVSGGAGGSGAAGASTATSTTASSSAASSGGAGAGGAPDCQLAALVDTFASNEVGPAWEEVETNGGDAFVHGGKLKVNPSGNGHSRAEILSAETFDLHGCSMFARRAKHYPEGVPAAMYMKAFVDADGTWLRIGVSQGFISFESRKDDIELAYAELPFDPMEHAYWRIQEAGQVLFETSPDGMEWTQHLVADTPAFASGIRVNLGASSYDDATEDPGEAHFDSFNEL